MIRAFAGGLTQPMLFITINGGGVLNPRSVRVVYEIEELLEPSKRLGGQSLLTGVDCKILNSLKEAQKIDENSVAIFDGRREDGKCFSAVPPKTPPAWVERFNWGVMVGERAESLSSGFRNCAQYTLAIFSRPFDAELKDGMLPWGPPRTAKKKKEHQLYGWYC